MPPFSLTAFAAFTLDYLNTHLLVATVLIVLAVWTMALVAYLAHRDFTRAQRRERDALRASAVAKAREQMLASIARARKVS